MSKVRIDQRTPGSTNAVAGSVVDENGAVYGVKQVGNCPRVVNQPYTYAIAEGGVSGHNRFRKLGYAPAIGTGLVDLWEIGTAAAYVFPTAGIQMRIKSGGNAQDAGSVGFSGTSTGGSTTTLIDTAKDFTGGTATVAGDMVVFMVDNRVQFGIVTTVAATTLTCSAGFSGGVTGVARAYSVIDRSAGGTGVQVVEVHYLDASWQEKETFAVLAGATEKALTPSDVFRVNNFHSILSGQTAAGGAAAAAINLTNTAETVTYSAINTGNNSSNQAIWTVPALDPDGTALTAAYITQWHGGVAKATGTPVGTLRLRATMNEENYVPGTFTLLDVVTIVDGMNVIPFDPPIKIPAKVDIKISAISSATATICTGSFLGWYE